LLHPKSPPRCRRSKTRKCLGHPASACATFGTRGTRTRRRPTSSAAAGPGQSPHTRDTRFPAETANPSPGAFVPLGPRPAFCPPRLEMAPETLLFSSFLLTWNRDGVGRSTPPPQCLVEPL